MYGGYADDDPLSTLSVLSTEDNDEIEAFDDLLDATGTSFHIDGDPSSPRTQALQRGQSSVFSALKQTLQAVTIPAAEAAAAARAPSPNPTAASRPLRLWRVASRVRLQIRFCNRIIAAAVSPEFHPTRVLATYLAAHWRDACAHHVARMLEVAVTGGDSDNPMQPAPSTSAQPIVAELCSARSDGVVGKLVGVLEETSRAHAALLLRRAASASSGVGSPMVPVRSGVMELDVAGFDDVVTHDDDDNSDDDSDDAGARLRCDTEALCRALLEILTRVARLNGAVAVHGAGAAAALATAFDAFPGRAADAMIALSNGLHRQLSQVRGATGRNKRPTAAALVGFTRAFERIAECTTASRDDAVPSAAVRAAAAFVEDWSSGAAVSSSGSSAAGSMQSFAVSSASSSKRRGGPRLASAVPHLYTIAESALQTLTASALSGAGSFRSTSGTGARRSVAFGSSGGLSPRRSASAVLAGHAEVAIQLLELLHLADDADYWVVFPPPPSLILRLLDALVAVPESPLMESIAGLLGQLPVTSFVAEAVARRATSLSTLFQRALLPPTAPVCVAQLAAAVMRAPSAQAHAGTISAATGLLRARARDALSVFQGVDAFILQGCLLLSAMVTSSGVVVPGEPGKLAHVVRDSTSATAVGSALTALRCMADTAGYGGWAAIAADCQASDVLLVRVLLGVLETIASEEVRHAAAAMIADVSDVVPPLDAFGGPASTAQLVALALATPAVAVRHSLLSAAVSAVSQSAAFRADTATLQALAEIVRSCGPSAAAVAALCARVALRSDSRPVLASGLVPALVGALPLCSTASDAATVLHFLTAHEDDAAWVDALRSHQAPSRALLYASTATLAPVVACRVAHLLALVSTESVDVEMLRSSHAAEHVLTTATGLPEDDAANPLNEVQRAAVADLAQRVTAARDASDGNAAQLREHAARLLHQLEEARGERDAAAASLQLAASERDEAQAACKASEARRARFSVLVLLQDDEAAARRDLTTLAVTALADVAVAAGHQVLSESLAASQRHAAAAAAAEVSPTAGVAVVVQLDEAAARQQLLDAHWETLTSLVGHAALSRDAVLARRAEATAAGLEAKVAALEQSGTAHGAVGVVALEAAVSSLEAAFVACCDAALADSASALAAAAADAAGPRAATMAAEAEARTAVQADEAAARRDVGIAATRAEAVARAAATDGRAALADMAFDECSVRSGIAADHEHALLHSTSLLLGAALGDACRARDATVLAALDTAAMDALVASSFDSLAALVADAAAFTRGLLTAWQRAAADAAAATATTAASHAAALEALQTRLDTARAEAAAAIATARKERDDAVAAANTAAQRAADAEADAVRRAERAEAAEASARQQATSLSTAIERLTSDAARGKASEDAVRSQLSAAQAAAAKADQGLQSAKVESTARIEALTRALKAAEANAQRTTDSLQDQLRDVTAQRDDARLTAKQARADVMLLRDELQHAKVARDAAEERAAKAAAAAEAAQGAAVAERDAVIAAQEALGEAIAARDSTIAELRRAHADAVQDIETATARADEAEQRRAAMQRELDRTMTANGSLLLDAQYALRDAHHWRVQCESLSEHNLLGAVDNATPPPALDEGRSVPRRRAASRAVAAAAHASSGIDDVSSHVEGLDDGSDDARLHPPDDKAVAALVKHAQTLAAERRAWRLDPTMHPKDQYLVRLVGAMRALSDTLARTHAAARAAGSDAQNTSALTTATAAGHVSGYGARGDTSHLTNTSLALAAQSAGKTVRRLVDVVASAQQQQQQQHDATGSADNSVKPGRRGSTGAVRSAREAASRPTSAAARRVPAAHADAAADFVVPAGASHATLRYDPTADPHLKGFLARRRAVSGRGRRTAWAAPSSADSAADHPPLQLETEYAL